MQKKNKNKFLLFEVHSVTCPVVRLCTEKILTRVKMPFFKNVKTGKKSSVAWWIVGGFFVISQPRFAFPEGGMICNWRTIIY